jgi:fructokinase
VASEDQAYPAGEVAEPDSSGAAAQVLVIGEALVDEVSRAGSAPEEHVGGSPANVALGLAALDHRVDLATWIATDERGNRIADHCREGGVRLTAGSQGARFTSVAHASLDDAGAATYRFELEWQLAPVPELTAHPHVHTGSLATVLEPGGTAVRDALRVARPSATISYDPNARPSLMGDPRDARLAVEECVALADVVKVSDEDVAWLRPGEPLEDVLADWASMGPSLIVATRGADGVITRLSRTGETHVSQAHAVTVVDTVGAGDSFMAGLVSGLLDAGLLGTAAGRDRLRRAALTDVAPAVDRALMTGALTVARAGAHAPRRRDLSAS